MLIKKHHLHFDKSLPFVPDIPSLRCEDHATFVGRYEDKEKFIRHWSKLKLKPMPTWFTKNYPGEHIALVENPSDFNACDKMIGLTVSKDPKSPINKSIRLYGGTHIDSSGNEVPGKLQHIAYEVDPLEDIKKIKKILEKKGVKFMTPVLEYKDVNGACLRQIFVQCLVPYGPFAEIIQRTLGPDGHQFSGFNANQIDNLYHYYDLHSKKLLKNNRSYSYKTLS